MSQTQTPYHYSSPSNVWLEREEARKRRSKFIVIGSIIALLGIVAVAVVVAVVLTRKGSRGSSSTTNNPVQTDPNDPSKFTKNPKLKRSFYGLAYTPEGSIPPQCGATLPQVILDIQLMSQLTKRVRLYGAECNQSALVLEAIKQTKVDMEVFLGNYALPDDKNVAYNKQRDAIQSALQTYGADHVAGVTVGNEFMLNYLVAHGAGGSGDPNSAIGDQGAALLIADIQDTRKMLSSLSLSKTLPVGNSDAGSFFNTKVLQAVDYGMANVHAWFANVSIDAAADWTASFFDRVDVQPAAAVPNKPKMYIAETGWPTKSSDEGNKNNGASPASLENLQKFIDTFVCQANANGTAYFFFEYFDETWKDKQFGGVEGWWGLFNSDRTFKALTIPDCPPK